MGDKVKNILKIHALGSGKYMGSAVLLKLVIQCLAAYPMGMFRLTTTLCEQLKTNDE